ncbi:MAG: type I 3-dehydroquinate dehydratase [Nanoarchaeota archaeon]|nr:type I 3-dehydroquinate dehydratase [Nanoarchaeota archaeon]
MNLFLIGYRGSGKTSTTEEVALSLGYRCIHIDYEVESRFKIKISEYIASHGWESYRDLETEILLSLRFEKDIVVDCSGGIILRRENVAFLKKHGIVIWLRTSPDILKDRLKSSYVRPAIEGKDYISEVDKVLSERVHKYIRAADHIIDTDNKAVADVVKEVCSIEKYGKCNPVCVLAEDDFGTLVSELKKAEEIFDFIEIRLDTINGVSTDHVKKILSLRQKKMIISCKRKLRHGLFVGEEKKRVALYEEAIKNDADFIDIGISSGVANVQKLISEKRETKVILSEHFFGNTPNHLEKAYSKLKALEPDLVRIACDAKSVNDNFKLFTLLAGKKDLIAYCLGGSGSISRVLSGKYGSVFSYTCLGTPTSPGMLTYEELGRYNFQKIDRKTKVFGNISENAEKSILVNTFNKVFLQEDINAVYVPFKLRSGDLHEFMHNYRQGEISGVVVSTQFKEHILRFLDSVDDTTKQINYVSTIFNQEEVLIGRNFDGAAAAAALEEKTGLKGKKVLVIGAGTTARALVSELSALGSEVTICNRTNSKAKNISETFAVNFLEYKERNAFAKDAQIIINATSCGSSSAPESLSLNYFSDGKIYMDLLYIPRITRFLEKAREAGSTIICGDRVLAWQIRSQLKCWTGTLVDADVLQKAISESYMAHGSKL